MRKPVLLLLALSGFATAAERPGLLFREDWTRTPPNLPATQRDVANPNLVLSLHGPGASVIKKSHHERPLDDPYYVWSGLCQSHWAVSLRLRDDDMDLSRQAKIRWRAKQSGFRALRVIVQIADGQWLVSEASDGPSTDWRVREFNVADLRWRALDIERMIESGWIAAPDLSRVREVGFTDLMNGGRSLACSRLDWIEVDARRVPR